MLSKITNREKNLFHTDLTNLESIIAEKVNNKSAIVIGGGGSIGSYYIKELLKFNLKRLYIIDINENGLAELVRDIRSSDFSKLPEIKAYPINYAGTIFEKIYLENGPFEIVTNFAAHKHVRSEKDRYAIEAMFENNFINANKLLKVLSENRPTHFFCVSTDKATNPVSIMGATKRLMEDVIFSYKDIFNVTTARFANVAFSNGSLLESYIRRYDKNQPIVCPKDICRYFISPEEAGALCLLSCFIGDSGDIFIPKLFKDKDLIPLSRTVEAFFSELGIKIDYCNSELEAREKAGKIDHLNVNTYPVFLVETDTSGEKPYEEFFSVDDIINWNRFKSIGVIKYLPNEKINISELLSESADLFNKSVTKHSIVEFLSKYIDGFKYVEKGKSLDQKM